MIEKIFYSLAIMSLSITVGNYFMYNSQDEVVGLWPSLWLLFKLVLIWWLLYAVFEKLLTLLWSM